MNHFSWLLFEIFMFTWFPMWLIVIVLGKRNNFPPFDRGFNAGVLAGGLITVLFLYISYIVVIQ